LIEDTQLDDHITAFAKMLVHRAGADRFWEGKLYYG
jgi:hypothetical protein